VDRPLSRRDLLRYGVFSFVSLGAGALLSACGGGSETPTPEAAAQTTPTPTEASATAAASPTAGPSPTASGEAQASPEASGATADWDEVVAQAREEGQLVLYDGHGGAIPTIGYAAQEFQAEYGIQVDVSAMRASEGQERVRVEQQAGQPVADLVTIGSTQAWLMINQDKTVQPIGDLPNLSRVSEEVMAQAEGFGLTEYAVFEAIQVYGVLVNTRLVPEGEEPRTWEDVLDPKWSGQIIMDDPRAIGGGFVFFSAALVGLGEEFLRNLAAQEPVLTRNIADSANRVARGEFALMIPFALGLFPQVKDVPTVKVVMPEPGAPFVLQGISIPAEVRHPNAARLFIDYLLSDKIQEHLAANYLRPVVDSALEAAPPEARDLLSAPLLGTSDPPRSEERLALAAEIFQE